MLNVIEIWEPKPPGTLFFILQYIIRCIEHYRGEYTYRRKSITCIAPDYVVYVVEHKNRTMQFVLCLCELYFLVSGILLCAIVAAFDIYIYIYIYIYIFATLTYRYRKV